MATEPEDRDSGMVECPCGVTRDDGQAMIECERCKVGTQQPKLMDINVLNEVMMFKMYLLLGLEICDLPSLASFHSVECTPCWAQVWAHISCLQNQMTQHPKQFRYNLEHYMCDLCQQELREQAANAASRSEQASPRNGLAPQGRKPSLHSAFAAEVSQAQPEVAFSSEGGLLSGGKEVHCYDVFPP